ncbi:odorant receptor 13a [Drosophila sulfurigaster albostrigata]|uniref:odorant receptor 13a n=1 Tax=Drosophila sulfurigaster albostrigata TaxID=89887 RepID=UPI002D2196B4|nr:odorant receptor 13a [Drosophila sulfurigaster albostrigata]
MFNPKSDEHSNFYMPFQCIWLKLNGSWPLEYDVKNGAVRGENFFRKAYSCWSWYVIVSVGITISFQTSFLIDHFGDIIMLTENCCTTLMGVLNFVRLLHLRLNQNQLRELVQEFVSNIWIPDNKSVHITKECRKRMITFRVMTMLLSCLILMYCILPLVQLFSDFGMNAEDKPFPYKMGFPFNPYRNWMSYAATYLFTSYAGICVVTTLFAEDSLFGFFITYTCGQFRLLHERVEVLIVMTKANSSNNADITKLQRNQTLELHSCARQHNKIICFAKRLEDFFSPILLINLIISALLICMVGFQLVTSKYMFIGDYMKFIIYISSAISQLYIICKNGDLLIQHSTITAWHLYNCDWDGVQNKDNTICAYTNSEFRTNLQFMIMCSQRPVRITTFKFSTLSLQSFTAILSTSMSYFTLLRSLLDDSKV